jgi:hypothetical protein
VYSKKVGKTFAERGAARPPVEPKIGSALILDLMSSTHLKVPLDTLERVAELRSLHEDCRREYIVIPEIFSPDQVYPKIHLTLE